MRIERVDDRTVKCYLSNEELEEYEIDYRDFITHSEKAKELVQEIMEQASEEVGYKPPKFAFDIQIMVVPEQGLVLTFSDKDSEVGERNPLLECLREMKRILQKTREMTEQQGIAQKAETAGSPEADGKIVGKEPEAARKEKIARPTCAVFMFSSLRDLMNYAAVLPGNLRVESALYILKGSYFLYLARGHASYERYGRACVQAMEFSVLHTAEENRMQQIREQGECLIAEKALKKLRG